MVTTLNFTTLNVYFSRTLFLYLLPLLQSRTICKGWSLSIQHSFLFLFSQTKYVFLLSSAKLQLGSPQETFPGWKRNFPTFRMPAVKVLEEKFLWKSALNELGLSESGTNWKLRPETQFLDPFWVGDKVGYCLGLSYCPARLHSPPYPQSQGLRI